MLALNKFIKYRLAAGLRSDPLGELKRSLNSLAAITGPTYNERGGEGREVRGMEGREREGEGKVRGREGVGAPHLTCLMAPLGLSAAGGRSSALH